MPKKNYMPEMKPVDSAIIAAIGYNKESQDLYIRFNTGRIYKYSEVPPELYQQFEEAESQGKFFHQHIRNTYQTQEI